VKRLVFPVGKVNSDYKTNKKDSGKSPLTSCEHLFQIFNKFTQMYPKVVICSNNKFRFKMQKQLNAVKEFHTSFGLGVSHEMRADLGEQKNMLRFNLMKEENEEYLEAVQNNDLIEIADALGDMLYILCGTILEHGLQHKIEEVFDEIQRSNMSKLGEDGNPIYREDGKVMKGPNYFKPSFEEILK
jgi:predicted HAD superfamily Cof-like phosphohydrolase